MVGMNSKSLHPSLLKDINIYGVVNMAKWEIHKRFGLPDNLWWKFMPGTTVVVKWPNGPIMKDFEDQYKSDEVLLSADPNDHYRPWLERNVGKQGWDWNWRINSIATGNYSPGDTLMIKFRRKKSKWATAAALKWS
jgi:hypothetical protein